MTQLRDAVAQWRQKADAERAMQDEERRFERRRLHVSATLDGMVRLDGELDPDTGQTVLMALRAVEDADVRSRVGQRSGEKHGPSAEPMPGPPPSAGRTRSVRSAGSGSTSLSVLWFPVSGRTWW